MKKVLDQKTRYDKKYLFMCLSQKDKKPNFAIDIKVSRNAIGYFCFFSLRLEISTVWTHFLLYVLCICKQFPPTQGKKMLKH